MLQVLEDADAHKYEHMTLGQYLDDNGYCTAFRNNYLLPMCAAVWSVPSAVVLKFPLRTLVRFWVNHHLLDIFSRPVWRVVKDRSRSYVNAVLATLKDVRTSTAVKSVTRSSASQGVSSGGVTVVTEDGKRERFDAGETGGGAPPTCWNGSSVEVIPNRSACRAAAGAFGLNTWICCSDWWMRGSCEWQMVGVDGCSDSGDSF